MAMGLTEGLEGAAQMGTYDASIYRRARVKKQCIRCNYRISVGERYLAYKPGLRSNCPICFSCSLIKNEGHPVYWCKAVVDQLEGAVAQMETTPMDAEQLAALLDLARRNGTVDKWADIAVEWAQKATQHVDRLHAGIDEMLADPAVSSFEPARTILTRLRASWH